jgi:hypothetical protein
MRNVKGTTYTQQSIQHFPLSARFFKKKKLPVEERESFKL